MIKAIAMLVVLCSTLPAWAGTVPWIPAAAGCTRSSLQDVTDKYLDALKKGTPSLMPLAPQAKYIESRKEVALGQGIWQKPLTVDFSRTLIDVDMGSVVGQIDFGGEKGLPDAHTFRLENGKLRYVHVITLCPNGCPKIPPPKE